MQPTGSLDHSIRLLGRWPYELFDQEGQVLFADQIRLGLEPGSPHEAWPKLDLHGLNWIKYKRHFNRPTQLASDQELWIKIELLPQPETNQTLKAFINQQELPVQIENQVVYLSAEKSNSSFQLELQFQISIQNNVWHPPMANVQLLIVSNP